MQRPANPELEYVLVWDHPPHARRPEDVHVPRGTVVTNVIYKPMVSETHRLITGVNTELEFTVKATGAKHVTNYGYMLADNTPENLSKLERVKIAREAVRQANIELEWALNVLDSVAGPFEGVFAKDPK